jgi:hypothetical protein
MRKAEPRADFTKTAGIMRTTRFTTKKTIKIIEFFFLEEVMEEYRKIIPRSKNRSESTKTAQADCLAA